MESVAKWQCLFVVLVTLSYRLQIKEEGFKVVEILRGKLGGVHGLTLVIGLAKPSWRKRVQISPNLRFQEGRGGRAGGGGVPQPNKLPLRGTDADISQTDISVVCS